MKVWSCRDFSVKLPFNFNFGKNPRKGLATRRSVIGRARLEPGLSRGYGSAWVGSICFRPLDRDRMALETLTYQAAVGRRNWRARRHGRRPRMVSTMGWSRGCAGGGHECRSMRRRGWWWRRDRWHPGAGAGGDRSKAAPATSGRPCSWRFGCGENRSMSQEGAQGRGEKIGAQKEALGGLHSPENCDERRRQWDLRRAN